jgi:CcmD family protein
MTFLYAAYGATWAIHVFYLWTLVRRYHRLRNEIEDLKKK